MKKRACLSAAVALLLLASVVLAQVPGIMNFQCKVMNNAGAALNNQTNNATDGRIDVRFTLWNAASGGLSVWTNIFASKLESVGKFRHR